MWARHSHTSGVTSSLPSASPTIISVPALYTIMSGVNSSKAEGSSLIKNSTLTASTESKEMPYILTSSKYSSSLV